jgi:hypothetical protein
VDGLKQDKETPMFLIVRKIREIDSEINQVKNRFEYSRK